ncbi:MAG: hypothetical protein DRJ03_07590 [Chloroflexi bacterium]|nr:MAG: hypothetical protein DRJ03_07590 [Chloroflexota bacterium]
METRRPNWLQKRIGQLVNSRLIGWIANLPPVAWVSRTVVRVLVKRRAGKTPVEESLIGRVVGSGLEATLEQIVYDVVEALGYTGAMVATYEQGDSLPVRALYVSPNLATLEQIHKWETEISKYTEQPVSITDPDIARVFVYQDEYKDNLSVRAFKAGGPVASSELYYLFTPIAPLASRPLVAGIQQALSIQEVIAVPFFLETLVNGQLEREIVGNLFVAKQGPISQQDKLVLSAFGRQAAAAIKSERRRLHIQVAQEIVFEMQSSLHDEVQILQQIVEGVVSDLGYVGAMVATYEPDDSLPVRALCISPDLATMEQIHEWETEISKYTKQPVSITDPAIARVFVYQDECRHNLSVRAFRAGGPVTSDALYDLFTPIAPPASKPVVGGIQQALGIQQVIAVPFFLRAFTGGRAKRECVGNLFAATRSKKLSAGEIELLKAFAQQAAVGIRNAQLYRKAEERRQVAQVFGKMAFSAAAFVHKLRNHIAAFQTHLHLVQVAPPDRRDEILALSDKMLERLNEAADILNHLHEPWREAPDVPTDINACLKQAVSRVVRDQDEFEASEGIRVSVALSENLPPIKTAPDMLTEAFRVLIKNSVEAIQEKGKGGELQIKNRLSGSSVVEVSISDSGLGIRPKDISKVFELQWSTKEAGMGFGLFWTKEYIEGLGGSVKVESVWREGTTFQVRLPSSVK